MMDMICPECLGALATSDGRTARCTVHGGEYKIMYSKDESNIPREAPAGTGDGSFVAKCPGCGQEFEAKPEHAGTTMECTSCRTAFEIKAPAVMCRRHPDVPAQGACARCGAQVCGTCAFPNSQGGYFCPDCAATPPAPNPEPLRLAPAPPPLPAFRARAPFGPTGVMCSVHPEVNAVQRCSICKAPICATCDFAFPGGIHACPGCASKPQTGVGKRRKKSLVISYVLAVWSTLGLAVLFSGALAGTVQSKSEQEMLGIAVMLLVFVPAIVGTAMAVSSIDRRLSNPASIWVSVVWNSIILAALLLLAIIGNMR